MSGNVPDQWLIRTAENQITGPFTRHEVCQFIQQGKLQANDEVCQANTYWFFLHEHEEIRKQLGIDLPKELYLQAEDSTQTQTDTEIVDATDPELQIGSTQISSMTTLGSIRTARNKETQAVPELAQPLDEVGENTAVMSNRAYRDYRQPVASTPSPVLAPVPVVRGGVDKSRLVKFFMYFMITGAMAILIFVIKLLHDRP